jgi:4-hydroxybutyryl-CoA dehydratase / vinylacetyl-CoA-Delta-isomerase
VRTRNQYIESLRDGRRVFYRGERVADVTQHPEFKIAIDHAALDFDLGEDERYRNLAVVDGHSRFFHLPRCAEDLLLRSRLIETATKEGATLVTLIKEIGSDALLGLTLMAAELGGPYPDRVARYLEYCTEGDLALAVAQTDVKGDRRLGPAAQANPDAYLRIVERRPDGIVVRGTKCHTSVSVNSNELIVLPTREMSEQDADYAVAFAVPVDTPGLSLIASVFLDAEGKRSFDHPISSKHKMIETTTVFQDVFVPLERVFLCGEWQYAGALAKTFVEFHRFTAVSYKLPLVDALLGAAVEIAVMNGIENAGHVRDKLSWLAAYAATVRGLIEQAANSCTVSERTAIAVPNTLITNVAKLHFAQNYHTAILHLQDIAGGLTVTAPSEEDLRSPLYGDHIERAYAGARGVSGTDRLRMMNLVSELTSSEYAGYQSALAIHAEGSIEAEKLTILRAFDATEARRYVRGLAGIGS